MLALTTATGIVLVALGALALALRSPGSSLRQPGPRETGPDIPDALTPGPVRRRARDAAAPSKLQGWSVVMLAFFVIWIPCTWIFEPSTNLNQEHELRALAIDRGSRAVQLFSEENQLGVGCVRCHGPELTGGIIQRRPDGEPRSPIPPNLTTICGGPRPPATRDLRDRTTSTR